MKRGKAQDIDGLTIEHIEFSHPALKLLLAKFFNYCIHSGAVPTRFGLGLTVPIPKNGTYRNNMKYEEFRGISINSVLSKIFENVILESYSEYLQTSDYQMGFKKGLGCQHVIYSVKEISDYYSVGGSIVNICTLDIKKAFDRVNYYTVLTKLLQKHLPVNIVCILATLFRSSYLVVKWLDTMSRCFKLHAGVRQGGVLSPVLFAVYVDSMLQALAESKLGCRVSGFMCSYFMYADDIILVTASLTDLQKLVNLCVNELSVVGLSVQAEKSAFICLGRPKKYRNLSVKININDILLDSVAELRCLGVHFTAGHKLKFQFDCCKAKFYNAINAILAYVGNKADVVLPQCNAQCVPILLYCAEAMSLTKIEKLKLSHPYFRLFGKLFNTLNNGTVNQCQWYTGCMPLEFLIDLRLIKFCNKLSNSNNYLIKSIYSIKGKDVLKELENKYKISHNSRLSWRTAIWRQFELSIDFHG